MDLAMVTWVDTFGCPGGWEFQDEFEPGYTTVTSVGHIEHQEDYVVLVPHMSCPASGERVQLAGHMTIPRCQIRKIEALTFSSSGPVPE